MPSSSDASASALSGATGHFRTLIERSGDLSILLTESGEVRYANPSIQRLLGHRVADLRGRAVAEIVHDADRQALLSHFGSSVGVRESTPLGEMRLRHVDGSFRWFDVVAADLRAHAGVRGLLLEARGANDGLWDWEIPTGQAFYSGRWNEMLGLPEGVLAGGIKEWTSRIVEDDLDRVLAEVDLHLLGVTSHFESEHRLRDVHDRPRWVLMRGLAVKDDAGRAVRMAGSCTDITRRKLAEEELQHAALRDVLTGLTNRGVLYERLGRRLGGARSRPGEQFALLYIDLDRFKVINDGLGHLAGDAMLVEVGRRLSGCVRPLDIVSRLGGDEFCLLLETIEGPDDAMRAAERVAAALRAPFHLAGQEVYTGASVGIAIGPGDYAGPEDVLRDADTALYRAKAEGRGGCRLFDAEMHARVVTQLKLESDLRRASDRGEFVVYLQPVVEAGTERIVGFEALARWRHPSRGILTPAEFLTSLEDMGLLPDLDRFILQESAACVAEWGRRHPGRRPWLSVNISPRQLERPGFSRMVYDALAASGLPPGLLKLEITESALMGQGESTVQVMRELAGHGIEFFLDDFGTGYSSLSYLHRLPIHALKIDRGFTAELGRGKGLPPVIQAIFHLALGLDLLLIAEGVETAAQAEALLRLGCRFHQGYHFSAPLPCAAAGSLLAARLDTGSGNPPIVDGLDGEALAS